MTRPLYNIYQEYGYLGAVIMLVIWLISGDCWEDRTNDP